MLQGRCVITLDAETRVIGSSITTRPLWHMQIRAKIDTYNRRNLRLGKQNRKHGNRTLTVIGCTLSCRPGSGRPRDRSGGKVGRRSKLWRMLHLTDRIRQTVLREIWMALHQTTYTFSPGASGCGCLFLLAHACKMFYV